MRPGHGGELRCDVGEDAGLRGDGVALADVVDEAEQVVVAETLSEAGLMPMTASPRAEEETVDDGGSDAGGVVGGVVGLEARGEAAREADGGAEAGDYAGFFAVTAMRSCTRMILETAAAISGVMPGAKAARVSVVASWERRQSRKPPTVREAIGAKALGLWVSKMRRVTSSVS